VGLPTLLGSMGTPCSSDPSGAPNARPCLLRRNTSGPTRLRSLSAQGRRDLQKKVPLPVRRLRPRTPRRIASALQTSPTDRVHNGCGDHDPP
jgi:hypothetical protein